MPLISFGTSEPEMNEETNSFLESLCSRLYRLCQDSPLQLAFPNCLPIHRHWEPESSEGSCDLHFSACQEPLLRLPQLSLCLMTRNFLTEAWHLCTSPQILFWTLTFVHMTGPLLIPWGFLLSCHCFLLKSAFGPWLSPAFLRKESHLWALDKVA